MVKCLIQINLEQHNVNKNISSEDVFHMLDPEQLNIFRDSMEKQLIKAVDAGISPRRQITRNQNKPLNMDFGNYPMKPWINKLDNPNQVMMKSGDVKTQNFFLPPRPRDDDLFILRLANDSYELTPQIRKSKLIERSWIEMESLEASIQRINDVIRPSKEKLAQNEKFLFRYLLIGLVIVAILAIILGILVHFALAIVVIILYIIGLAFVIRRFQKENDFLLKKIHFNVCLLIRNENDRFYSRHNIKARVGYLSQWIEFHAVNQHSDHFSVPMPTQHKDD